MIIIHAEFTVDSSKHQAFVEEIQPLITGSRQEAGNISYDLLKDTEQVNRYTMVEVWQDEQAVQLHNASEHFTTFVAKAGNFLTEPLLVKSFNAQPITN